MKWSNIKNGRLDINRAKNENRIDNKLNKTVLEILNSIPILGEYVFRLPTTTNGINKVLKVWVKNSGIQKHITFYCARHTFAVLSLESSNNLKITSKLMGHTSTKSTDKYLVYIDKQKDNAIDNIPEVEIAF